MYFIFVSSGGRLFGYQFLNRGCSLQAIAACNGNFWFVFCYSRGQWGSLVRVRLSLVNFLWMTSSASLSAVIKSNRTVWVTRQTSVQLPMLIWFSLSVVVNTSVGCNSQFTSDTIMIQWLFSEVYSTKWYSLTGAHAFCILPLGCPRVIMAEPYVLKWMIFQKLLLYACIFFYASYSPDYSH